MKIEIKSNNFIPVEIGYLNFSISLDDNNLLEIVENYKKVEKEMVNLKSVSLQDTKPVLLRGFDAMLGDGAGIKIYEQTPSTRQCMMILTQLVIQLKEELNDIYTPNEQMEAISEYLTK